jgi:hypothetical protein
MPSLSCVIRRSLAQTLSPIIAAVNFREPVNIPPVTIIILFYFIFWERSFIGIESLADPRLYKNRLNQP